MKSFCLSAVFFLVSCGSSVDKLADAISASNATPTPVPGAVTAPGTQPPVVVAPVAPVTAGANNADLELAILGTWDLYSRGCEGEDFSFEIIRGGSCYVAKQYSSLKYKCTWQWIGQAQMQWCICQDCRTDMMVSFDKSSSMMTIVSSKCTTEYKRPELK